MSLVYYWPYTSASGSSRGINDCSNREPVSHRPWFFAPDDSGGKRLRHVNQRALVNKAAPKEELEFTQRFVELLQRRDLIEVGVQFDQEALQAMQDDVILALADLVPDGPPVAISLQGVNVKRYASGVRLTGLSLEYGISQSMVTGRDRSYKKIGRPADGTRHQSDAVARFIARDQRIPIGGKANRGIPRCRDHVGGHRIRRHFNNCLCRHDQAAMVVEGLLGASASLPVSGVCWLNGRPGQVELELFNFNFFSTSIGRLGPDGPYYFEAVLPVGAIAFGSGAAAAMCPTRHCRGSRRAIRLDRIPTHLGSGA